jgi:undecaprenyl-diphosphatase
VTHLGSHVAVLLFLLLSWGWTKRLSVFYAILLTYAALSLAVYGLKYVVRRKRPPLSPSAASKIARGPGEIIDPSFPSAHAGHAFMMATFLGAIFPQYRILFLFLAAFIGWTRIYLGLHYPTDVITGGLLGYGIPRVFLFLKPFG